MGNSNTLSQPYEGFVTNGNVKTHFLALGQGPLIVLVHGFPDNAATWKQQMEEFSKSYTVVCPTLRGYPPSDVPENLDAYPLPVVAADFIAILDHFKVEKAVIGGHDFGGGAIQLVALMHPNRVAGLIIINAPIVPRFDGLVNFDEEQQKLSEYTIKYIQYQPGDNKNEKFVTRLIRDDAHRESVQEYLASSPMYGMFNYYKMNYPAPPYGQESKLPPMKYQIPTLILWGLEEEYFSMKMLDGLTDHFTASTRVVLVPGAGHWSFRDKPETINREIWSWLGDLSPDEPSLV
ncbi:epoxide hydrolase-like protein [Ilyonectria sp. MPI-CAGE-AT-0026]|nr:epoxide hydrolase-like protein [Ilyonectria sp. MPI-CAGE-AT-0026]